jgi:hypothetical protein
MKVLGAVYGISWAWSSVNPVTLVRSWRNFFQIQKLIICRVFLLNKLTGLESLTLYMLWKVFKTLMKMNWASSTWQTHCQCHHETKWRRRGWKDEIEEEEESSEHVSHCMALQCVSTFVHYLGQRQFEYSGITAARKICTSVRMNPNSSLEQATIKKYFWK